MARTGAGVTDCDGYLSKDRAYLTGLQRQRRARMVRIDFMPAKDVLTAIDAKRATVTAIQEAANSTMVEISVRAAREIKPANMHRRHLSAGQQAAIVASAQDWASAQTHGGSRKKDQVATLPLETIASRATQSGASDRTQRMADKVAKESPALARQVAHGDPIFPPYKGDGQTASSAHARRQGALANLRQFRSPAGVQGAAAICPAPRLAPKLARRGFRAGYLAPGYQGVDKEKGD